jgi:PAS domain S-box-containing protein
MNGCTHLSGIINSLPVCIMLLDPDGSIREMNPAGLAMVEADSFELVKGKPYHHIVAPEFRSSFQALVRKVTRGETDSLEYQITGLKGTRRWLDVHAVPFRNSDSPDVSILTVTRDTTERVQREGKTRYDQKMEIISTLTSGIAHDFNNILTAIIGYATVMKMKLTEDDRLRPMALQILAASERASGLTKGMLSFGSKQILNLKQMDVNDIVRKVSRAFEKTSGDSITVSLNLAATSLASMVDEDQIEQSLLNIMTNARDAMPSKGTISISTEIMELEDTFISIHGYGVKGTYGVIAITDTGHGMDERTRRKVFEPFFTTKEPGKGTGLGLAIVYGCIKSHGGFVNVYSEPGTGTTFRVYLPISDDRTYDASSMTALFPEGKGETILISDDEDGVRKVMTTVLERFGYRVLQAADGEEALRIFREQADHIHLVMLDVFMPRLNGNEVYDEIIRLRPGTRVVFTSGYTADIVRQKRLLSENVPFISKPVSPRDLLSKIREVLDT